jgi:hypothetical protein
MPESMSMLTLALWAVVVLLFVIGLAGLVLPALPGSGLLLAGILLGAWLDDFQRVSWPVVLVCAALAVLALLTDYVAALLGAKRVGAHPFALVGAALGTLIGVFSGLVGLLVFPLLGAGLGEWIGLRGSGGMQRAAEVGLATWIGFIVGSVVKLALGFAMIGLFVIALWF